MQDLSILQQDIKAALETGTSHAFVERGSTVLVEYAKTERFNDYNASITIDGKYLYTIQCMNASNLANYVIKQVEKELSGNGH